MRTLIKEADPDVVEEWKWVKRKPGTPNGSHDGIICTGESYKSVGEADLRQGRVLKDPARLFNSSLDGNVRRRSTSTKEKRSTRPRSRRSFARPVALNSSGKSKPFEESEVLRGIARAGPHASSRAGCR